MEYTIEELIKILQTGVKMCVAKDKTTVQVDVEVAREAAYYLEDMLMIVSPGSKGGESG